LVPYALLSAALLPIVFTVAYTTLADRKGMGALQRRVGPDTTGLQGVIQPFADALKLIVKELVHPFLSRPILGLLLPWVTLSCSLLGFTFIPLGHFQSTLDFPLQVIANMALFGLAVHGVLYVAWSGENNYSFIGAVRTSAQLVSYELTLSTSFLAVTLLQHSLNYSQIQTLFEWAPLSGLLSFIFPIFAISALAEAARVPFDLPEAESEIVAGFMTELSAVPFVLYFLAEYSSLVLLATLSSLLFYSLDSEIGILILLSAAVLARAVLPRLRYDQLITLG
jgi:NADH-ubiquinone oxidoreductase chain 1